MHLPLRLQCVLYVNALIFVSALSNLFTDGQLGLLLGTEFGLPGTNATFDYVIVGGGNAGLTLGSRLAQDRSITVAVIEAGGFYEIDNGNLSVIPGATTWYTGSDPKNYNPLIDWGFDTTPQVGANNRTIHYARGKTLGGSSARNYMMYQRSTVQAQQLWADQVGDDSYTWDNLLPFYLKSAHYTPPDLSRYVNTSNTQDDSAFSPTGGPLQVSFSNWVDSFGTWARRGLINIGMAQIPGFHNGSLIGSAYATLTIDPRNAQRSSSESSFLQAALQNGTAPTIYKNSFARRILFNGTTATGVLVTTSGSYGIPDLNYTLTARKEVISCAGALQSPQLLMVSGIGPRQALLQHDIAVIKDLPGVGQNMWDHVSFGVGRRVNIPTASAALNNATLSLQNAQLYRNNATGPLSVLGAGYFGWEKLPQPYRSALTNATLAALAAFPADWPEIEWIPTSAFYGWNLNRQTADPRDGYNYAMLNCAIITPLSRGNVTIQSADMTIPPLIDPNWLTEAADAELAVQAVKRQREVWAYLASQGVTVGDEYLPGANVSSDPEILAYVRNSTLTVFHPAATCKMGRSNDTQAVVDSHGKVFGVQNLRIVDASSMPFLPPGHPQATIYAFAEKIAAEILDANARSGS